MHPIFEFRPRHVLLALVMVFFRAFSLWMPPPSKPVRSVVPGKSTKFKVNYRPGRVKTGRATLRITSNDKDENPFRVKLVGKGAK